MPETELNKETSLNESTKCCSGEMLRRRWKQFAVLGFFVLLIIYLIVDTILKPCTIVEPENARVLRLFCADALEVENGTLVEGQPFMCSKPNSTNSEWMPCLNDPNNPVCIREASCVEFGLTAFIGWIADNVAAGFFATAIVYAIAAVLLIPGSILTLGAGAAFGTALGLGIGVVVAAFSVWLGASAGAAISFLLGKYLLRDFTEILINKYKVIRAIDSSLGDEGFKITLLLRFSPVVPFSAFNYVMGATACSFRNYILATLVGIFPGTLAFVFIGAAVAVAATGGMDGDDMTLTADSCANGGADIVTIIVLVVGIAATFIAVVIIGKYSRKKFQKYVQEEEEEKQGSDEESQREDAKIDVKNVQEPQVATGERIVAET